MKKITTVIVAALYVAGIVIISFFGAALSGINVKIYAQNVTFIGKGITVNKNGQKTIEIIAEEYPHEYQLTYTVSPDNATDKSVDFEYDKENPGFSVSDDGIVTFYASGTFDISVVTADGGKQSDTLKMSVIKRNEIFVRP